MTQAEFNKLVNADIKAAVKAAAIAAAQRAMEVAQGDMDQEGDFVTQATHAAWVAATEAFDAAKEA